MIDKPLDKIVKRRQKTQINKIIYEKGNITTNITEIQRITREYFKHLYSSKVENLKEMNKFLDACALPKLDQEDLNHLTRPIQAIKLKYQ
jgi:16S rRNA C1402 N4-methylase RsmH